MAVYDLYLESESSGRTHAHVLAVPGCFATGETRDAAFTAVTDILHRQFPDQPVALSVAEESSADHPIFAPERQPMSRAEVDHFLAVAAQNRAELLALVQPLVPAMRRWQPTADQMSINDIVRHIGVAEWWYTTRLLGKLPKPPHLPLMKFLAHTRQTAVSHLRTLTDEQLTAVITQPYRTNAPQEEWSARKLLRRLLEHEREHITQIHEILAQWRVHYLARLRAERASFLWQLRNLSEPTLSTAELQPGWTPKDIIAHTAYYDAFHSQRMQMVLDGRTADIQPVGGEAGLDAHNAALLAQFKETPPEQAVAMLLKERGGFQATLGRIPDSDLHRQIVLPWGRHTSLRVWANWRYQHDEGHGRQLELWRQTLPRETFKAGAPKYLLRAMLHATRKAFQSLLPLIPQAEWTTRPVCGVWTMKDLFGHLTDWEWVGVDGLRQLAAGQTPEFEYTIPDFNVFNNANAAARQNQTWAEVWADYEAARETMLALLEQTSEASLQRLFATPWGGEIPGTTWMLIWPGHEMEHAIDVRAALGLKNWPKRFLRHL